jgi:hypothetical protein
VGCPFDLLAIFQLFPELTLGVVGIFSANFCCLICCELLLSMLGEEMVLDVSKLSFLVDPFECVATIAVVVAVVISRPDLVVLT